MKFHRDTTSKKGYVWVTKRLKYGITISREHSNVCVLTRPPWISRRLAITILFFEVTQAVLMPFIAAELMKILKSIPNHLRRRVDVQRVVDRLANRVKDPTRGFQGQFRCMVTASSLAAYLKETA